MRKKAPAKTGWWTDHHTQITTALIGAGGAVIGAVLGAVLSLIGTILTIQGSADDAVTIAVARAEHNISSLGKRYSVLERNVQVTRENIDAVVKDAAKASSDINGLLATADVLHAALDENAQIEHEIADILNQLTVDPGSRNERTPVWIAGVRTRSRQLREALAEHKLKNQASD